eukprot:115526-Alexandrium_andersonii.AAC.1
MPILAERSRRETHRNLCSRRAPGCHFWLSARRRGGHARGLSRSSPSKLNLVGALRAAESGGSDSS